MAAQPILCKPLGDDGKEFAGIQSKNSTDDDDPDYDGSSSGSIWDAN